MNGYAPGESNFWIEKTDLAIEMNKTSDVGDVASDRIHSTEEVFCRWVKTDVSSVSQFDIDL